MVSEDRSVAESLVRHRFSVDDYYRIAEAGILNEDSRVELIEGEIVEMTAVGARHAACVMRLNHLLAARAAGRAIVNVQNPVRLSAFSEPQPDLALLRPRDDFYARAHPGPQDVLLVIEVAETSSATDRGVKAPLYAGAGIAEMWLVDLNQGVVEAFRDPSPGGYRRVLPYHRGEVLSPEALADVKLEIHEILE
jgi:Uma2 family endonuclease